MISLFSISNCGLPLRVQCKPGPDYRLVGAIQLTREFNLPYQKILKALVCGCRFRAKGEDGKMHPSDIELAGIYQTGIRKVLTRICGFDESKDKKLIEQAEEIDNNLKS